MPSTTQLLSDIDLRYRNTFSVPQKLVWFNEEQRELFDILEMDSPPYTFQTVAGESFYPFPDQFDVTKIKVVTLQVSESEYMEVPFKRNDDNQMAGSVWYTIASDAMYLHVSNDVPGNRNAYIYCDSDPVEVTTVNVSEPPSLPIKYHELLKLGVLKRIAAARKDIQMSNNYDMEHEQKVTDVLWQRKLAEPEWTQPIDNQSRAGNRLGYGSPWRD